VKKITLIHAKHLPYNDGHLGEVLDTMQHAGPPTIRTIIHGKHLIALEGSHRLAGAHILGLIPKLVILEPDLNQGPLDNFFNQAIATLPVWQFPFVWKLYLNKFK
jgi:hypothetical protein